MKGEKKFNFKNHICFRKPLLIELNKLLKEFQAKKKLKKQEGFKMN
jgi:hypothetical protein